MRLCQDRPQSWGTHTKPVENLAKSTHLDTRDSQRASEVEEALFRCGTPRVCEAILSDFDRSVYLSDYFDSDARVLSSVSPYSYALVCIDSVWHRERGDPSASLIGPVTEFG